MLRLTPFLLAFGLLALPGCSGESATSPEAPATPTNPQPSPVVDPLVTIQMTYNCHPCVDDPDHYEILIDCCPVTDTFPFQLSHPANWLLEHNTITFTGRLAPGRHNFDLKVDNAETEVVVTLTASGAPGNTGGIRPDSLALSFANTSVNDVLAISRCGLVNTFRNRPNLDFESVFAFDVVLGSAGSVC